MDLLDRRNFIRFLGAGVGAVALAGLAGCSRPAEDPAAVAADPGRRMNVLFVLTDDQRWDMLGAAGNHMIRTPNMDRLAKEGVYFKECVTVCSLCIPSRAALLTGLPPHQNGFFGTKERRTPLPFDRIPTLAGTLRGAGYHTVMAGKWHTMGYAPWTMGFTESRSWLPKGNTVYLDPELSQGQSMEMVPRKGYTNEIFANDIAAFITSKKATEQPFFAYLALTAPHGPSAPNREHLTTPYLGKTDAELAPPGLPSDAMKIKAGDWPEYYAAVATADDCLGKVLTALDEAKLTDNTVVIFLSDNGYMMGSRGLEGKRVPYEESIRVPMMVRWPGMTRFTGATDAQVSSLDVSATIVSVAGVRPPANWPGRNLVPALQDRAAPGFESSFAEFCDNEPGNRQQFRMVRTRTHKLIRWERPDQADEFYNLANDPHETRNLIAAPEEAETLAGLTKLLEARMDTTGDYAKSWSREKVPPAQ